MVACCDSLERSMNLGLLSDEAGCSVCMLFVIKSDVCGQRFCSNEKTY